VFFVLIFWSAFEVKSSIIFFYCCLDSWTVLLSSIIVLAIVQSLYIPFALSSDARCLHVYFLDFFLGMVLHARMIDVQTSIHEFWHEHYLPPDRIVDNPLSTQVIYFLYNWIFIYFNFYNIKI
jgi:hypothetical protein